MFTPINAQWQDIIKEKKEVKKKLNNLVRLASSYFIVLEKFYINIS